MSEKHPQPCPTCFALPDWPCCDANGSAMKRVHQIRKAKEYGGWLRKYDTVYRDRVPGWDLNPYSKRRAA